MAKFDIIMPKLGESIIEATITKWLKEPGDTIEEDDAIVEIATDKVDSEIPSPVEGVLKEVFFQEGDVVEVGKVIAVVETEGEEDGDTGESPEQESKPEEKPAAEEKSKPAAEPKEDTAEATRFYSPLVKNIARTEGITMNELESIQGSGKDGRVTKQDVLDYLKNKPASSAPAAAPSTAKAETTPPAQPTAPPVTSEAGDEIMEMGRMRKLIADHMVMSKQVSPHVTSFIEVDMTKVVNWRNKVKDMVMKREAEKITYTPILIEAAAQAIKDYPRINASVDGNNIIIRKHVNIGMAAALPDGNLIVPVIKNADQKSLLGLTKDVNDLANRARANKLLPDEIQGGTFTTTNFGSFASITGTPIINQPQVAILGIGAIRKKPVVIETPQGDMIGIRHMMILSLAYDHRIVDGALGGMYLKRVAELLENFDSDRNI
ncbi:MAG: dihydrolipoamide acetyltransferase family protein [Bacteroidales bacterium]|jgi:2-oxoglutarate dehydrogenase E2 component (dihydrolipoamide succinyltransferase)|nr:dihydrolipoamide acetyltransferase family protein [Bacteroidales bacterium]